MVGVPDWSKMMWSELFLAYIFSPRQEVKYDAVVVRRAIRDVASLCELPNRGFWFVGQDDDRGAAFLDEKIGVTEG